MTSQKAIFVVNAGSSSLKFQCFSTARSTLSRLFRGQIDGIGVRPRMTVSNAQGTEVLSEAYSVTDMPDLPAAIARMADWMTHLDGVEVVAMGHRVVHGGPDYAQPVRITPEVLAQLARYQELAPLHQPNNLAPIRLATQIAPDVPQIACFDTAFHRNKPAHADCYALPKPLYDAGVRRYGFHGLSYDYISTQLHRVAPELASGRVIVAHLGSGASMCALKGGESLDSTMGFTALDGLPMATRPGQLDPGVVLYLISHEGMSVSDVTDLVYHDAGLKGLSQISGDMRVLLDSDAKGAKFAIDHFVYRCAQHIGMMAASMGGVDGIIFTAGVGENSPEIRKRIVERSAWLGARLDNAANAAGDTFISTPDSALKICVVPTGEEWVIARDTLAILGL